MNNQDTITTQLEQLISDAESIGGESTLRNIELGLKAITVFRDKLEIARKMGADINQARDKLSDLERKLLTAKQALE